MRKLQSPNETHVILLPLVCFDFLATFLALTELRELVFCFDALAKHEGILIDTEARPLLDVDVSSCAVCVGAVLRTTRCYQTVGTTLGRTRWSADCT